MAYIGKQPGTGVRNRFLYTATAGQTTFTTSDSNLALSYSDALYMDVYLNGVLLDPANDYTATSGTSVVLGSGATAGDILEIVVYDVFSVFNNTIDGNFEVGGNTTLDNNLTVGGDLTVDTNTLHVDSTNNRVGVGITSPEALTHIAGATADADGSLGSQSPQLIIEGGNNNNPFEIGMDNSGATAVAFLQSRNKLAGAQFLSLNPKGGSTGVGTVSPHSELDVRGAGEIFTVQGDGGASAEMNLSLINGTVNKSCIINFGKNLSTSDRYLGRIIYEVDNNNMDFYTNGSNKFRIQTSGNIIQTSSISAGWSYAHNVTASSGQLLGHLIQFTGQAPNNASNYFLWMTDTSAARAYFRSDGGLANFQGNNANLSDEREKKNIEDAQDAWATVKSWQVRKFHFNEDADSDDKKYGVIAQEFQAHCPELITDYNKSPDPTSDPVIRLAVKEQGAMWLAIKALQEAQVKIETLETKVTTLETQNADLETKVASLETQNANFETRLTALEAE